MTAHEYVLPQTCRYSGKEQEDVSELTQDGGERQAALIRVHAERPMGSCTLMVCQRQHPLASTLRLISAPCVGGKKDLEITCDRHTLSNICCLYSVYIRLLMAVSGYLSTTCPSLTHSISVPSQPRGSICGKVMVVLSSPPKEKGSSWCQTHKHSSPHWYLDSRQHV